MYRPTLLIAFALSSATAAAQQVCASGKRAPDFGYTFASCHDCISVMIRNGVPVTRFTGEPALYQIRADGPAAGKLTDGDTLVSIDGLAIATEEAALRLAEFRAGTAKLTVRKNGVTRTVSVTPRPVCLSGGLSAAPDSITTDEFTRRYQAGVISREDYERALGHDEAADSLARIRAAELFKRGAITAEDYERMMGHYEVADSLARANALKRYRAGVIGRGDYIRIVGKPPADSAGFGPPGGPPQLRSGPATLGFGLMCVDCQQDTLPGGRLRWRFGGFPVVAEVVPGSPAANAGLRAGDTLRTIDGVSLRSSAGAFRLSSVVAGGAFKIGWQSAGKPRLAVMTPRKSLPLFAWKPLPHKVLLQSPQTIRLSDDVGTSHVEVRGPGATWTKDPKTGALTIRVDSVTVVIKPPK